MSKFKRAISYALSAVLALGIVSPVSAYKIADDVAGTKYEEAATVLGALGIMVGDDVGTFRPDDNISRAEFAKIAVHALGIENIASSNQGISVFPDVATDHWANG
ncbi:MAG: S-layer homology domain-containing protein, partial [Clostridia bacterium]|nr:S-layer homology domain-containing protein [Clostridia bacterium]